MSIYKEQIQNRIKSDLKAMDEAVQILESATGRRNRVSVDRSGSNRAALVNMLGMLGIKNADISHDDDHITRFKEILQENCYTFSAVKLEDGWWKDSNGPMLAISSSGSLVPLKEKGTGYAFLDPAARRFTRVRKGNSRDFSDSAIIFFRTLPNRAVSLSEYLRICTRGMVNFKFLFMVVLSVAVALLNMLIPYANKLIFDEVIPAGDTSALMPVLFVLLSIALSICLFSAVRNLVAFGIKDSFSINAQAAILHRALHLKSPFFKDFTAGDIATKILSASESGDEISESLISAFMSLIVGAAVFLQMGFFSHFTTVTWVVYLLLIAEMAMLAAGFRIRLKIKLDKVEHNGAVSGMMSSFWQGIQKIKTNGAEVRAFRNWAEEYSNVEYMSYPDSILLESAPFVNVVCMLAMIMFVPDSGISTSDYIAFYSAFMIVTSSIASLVPHAGHLTAFISMLHEVEPLLKAVPETGDGEKLVKHLSGAVTISDLHFRYDPSMPYVIDGVDISIRAGEYVAFTGPSGCGKSTLLRIITGLETPESGSVFYDEYNLATTNKSSLRQHIGTCLQSGRLFAGTIRENICISRPLATDDEIWEAARIAAVDEDIRRLPGGLDHRLDASGAGLSGGQRQRIMIARSVLNRPAVLLLDESTSALDNISQSKVIRNLGELKCTRIVIAHRLSTIRDCNRIFVFDKGRIVEEGDYDSLMARKGLFHKIAERQQL